MKKQLGQIKRNIMMLFDYFGDYKIYKKYNFGNYKNKHHIALEGKIRRQIHIIEKGMSLSNPRIGFGQEKIKNLFMYIDEYIELGYKTNSDVVPSAIGTLIAYLEFFKKQGYVNQDLEKKIKSYNINCDIHNYGLELMSNEELRNKARMEFPDFFESRCSVRQFSNKEIDSSVIEQAVQIARKSPSACNRQTAKVYFFKEKDINTYIGKELVEGSGGFDSEVKKYLVVTGERMAFTDSYERNQCIIDASLFAMNLVLALHYYGIGSCILQASEKKDLDQKRHEVLEIPDSEKIVLFIAIGYYKESFQVAKSHRKDIREYLIIK